MTTKPKRLHESVIGIARPVCEIINHSPLNTVQRLADITYVEMRQHIMRV
jgi:hypothetical protein